MLNIHITGAGGSIGSELSKELLAEGHHLIPAKDKALRIENKAYFEQFEKPENIDVLYHLAAISFVPASWDNPQDFIKINVLGTTHVLEFCRKYNIELIYISSYAYGIPQYLPIDEKHTIAAANPYGLSKIMGEQLCEFYGANCGVNYLTVRPFNVYGNLKNKNLLIPEIIAQIEEGKEIKVKDLNPKRDYVFIDDLVRFLVLAKENINKETYNVGGGVSLSVADIIATCQSVWGTNLKVSAADVVRKNEIPETLSDISKAKKDFKWEPLFNFEEGITAIKKRLQLIQGE